MPWAVRTTQSRPIFKLRTFFRGRHNNNNNKSYNESGNHSSVSWILTYTWFDLVMWQEISSCYCFLLQRQVAPLTSATCWAALGSRRTSRTRTQGSGPWPPTSSKPRPPDSELRSPTRWSFFSTFDDLDGKIANLGSEWDDVQQLSDGFCRYIIFLSVFTQILSVSR